MARRPPKWIEIPLFIILYFFLTITTIMFFHSAYVSSKTDSTTQGIGIGDTITYTVNGKQYTTQNNEVPEEQTSTPYTATIYYSSKDPTIAIDTDWQTPFVVGMVMVLIFVPFGIFVIRSYVPNTIAKEIADSM